MRIQRAPATALATTRPAGIADVSFAVYSTSFFTFGADDA